MSLIQKVDVPEGRRGKWAVERFTVKNDWKLLTYGARAPRPGRYTRLVYDDRTIVMSDVPAEMLDHIEFVMQAKGHVLINGLGLGMVLAAVLRKKEVTKVTVVEIDPDVIALVGPHYAKDKRVEIVQADACAYQPPKGVRYGAVWHDIWNYISEDNLPAMHALHRKYGRRTDWQGSWCRECIHRSSRYFR